MKFEIEKQVILKALTDVIKAIPAKPSLPILTNVLLELNDKGVLRLTAADGELIALRSIVKPTTFSDPGRITVPAKVFLDLLKTLPDIPVSFEQTNHNSFTIMAGLSEAELPTLPADEYIAIKCPDKDKAAKLEIVSDHLLEAIGKTIYAVATDTVRPVLGGLFFDLNPGLSSIVASDSRKLVHYDFETPDVTEAKSFILPAKTASVLKSVLQKEVTVKVLFDDSNARFAFGQNEITTRLVVGKYPKWRTIIPKDNSNVLTVKRDRLVNALQRMAILADRKALLTRVELNYNQVKLTAQDLNLSVRGSDTLECDYDGEALQIGLPVVTLTDVLGGIDCDTIEFQIKDASSAILILPEAKERKDEPVTAIVMPHRLQ